MITKIKLWLAAAGAAVLGTLVVYHKWVVARKKALERELRQTQTARKVEQKVSQETANLRVRQNERKKKVAKKKVTRSQGLGAGRRED